MLDQDYDEGLNQNMKRLVIGILAHVDAGKTTLSEGMLYLSGAIRKLGRVDKRDAYLDTHQLEKQRGITIFSKQAVLNVADTEITLLDTPGHVDFSAEMERTLHVLDYAILVISGADGVQGHTQTLWYLLERYQVPTFIFVNKMDQPDTDRDQLLEQLKQQLAEGCNDFSQEKTDQFYEQLAVSDEKLLEEYLESGKLSDALIKEAIATRKIFPCYFGSALKLEGVEQFLQGIADYSKTPAYPLEFGASIFKISRDEQGNRLTHLKITGGSLKVKDTLSNGTWEEKVNQIRIYSGDKFEQVNEVTAGSVCAITGLTQTKPGEGLGIDPGSGTPVLEPVLSYGILLPDGQDPKAVLPKLHLIEEEIPELHIVWDEQLQEIQVQIMGEVQIEILQSLVAERFGIQIEFGTSKILYKETIENTVEGVGHYEPHGHYAEIHLLLEPGHPGSGLQFDSKCSEDQLAKNWQNLVLTHLAEKTHKGVLTGSPITDMKISLVAGRAHNVHTEGGDFREATYRAVRQGLKEARSVLLEPYYKFQLKLPEQMVGRAMTDIDQMHGSCLVTESANGFAVLEGQAPVATMCNYHQEVVAYTKGQGRLFCYVAGYQPCHNADEVIASIGYDSESDIDEPTGSIFYAQGAGFYVSWDRVKQYMHLASYLPTKDGVSEDVVVRRPKDSDVDFEKMEFDFYDQAVNANKGKKTTWRKPKKEWTRPKENPLLPRKIEIKDNYLLVDGYNIIHAWPELQQLADDNMDLARSKLLDALCNYQAIRKCRVMVVFDAYRVPGHQEEISDYRNIQVVFTKEAQTADEFIERFAHEHRKKYHITVATSDSLQQIIIRSAGSALLSATDLWHELEQVKSYAKQINQSQQSLTRNYIGDTVDRDIIQQIESLKNETEDKQ